MELGLQISDIDHLYKFKEFCKTDYEVKIKHSKLKYKNDEIYESCRIVIYNTVFCNYLIMQGCTPRKSLTLKYKNNIKDEYIKDFIRGYFDGDGCIAFYDYGQSIQIEGTHEFLTWIKQYISSAIKTKNNILIYKRKNHSTLRLNGKNDSLLFLNYIYKNSKISLNRKYLRYLELSNE